MDELEREALHGTFHRLEQRWNLSLVEDDPDWHLWDPLPFWDFLDGVAVASHLTTGRRFLDLGCGIGTKLAIMHHLGWEVAGVEKRSKYIQAARELVPEATLEQADLMGWTDFSADLVYMYRPARPDDLQAELEAHVIAHSQPGTVMFWPFRHDPEVWKI